MDDLKLRKIFIWVICVMGLLSIMLTPPLAVPDENAHFLNAYSFSQGDLWAEADESKTVIGKYFPNYILDFMEKYKDSFAGDLKKKYSFKKNFYESWKVISEDEREEKFYVSDLTSITPWAYIFSGLAMKLMSATWRIMGAGYDNAYNFMIAGRFGNFLFYVIVSYIAVSITPCLRKTMMLLLSMPMTLFLGASLSYDAVLIPVTFLFFAELMRLILNKEEQSVAVKDMIIIAICTFFLAAIKMAYAPFIVLLLFIPMKKFKSKKQYFTSIGIVIGAGVLGIIFPKVLHYISTGGVVSATHPNILIQQEYLYGNLYETPKIIGRTLINYANFYISSFVGKIGTLDTNLPIPYICMFLMVLIIVALCESCTIEKISWKFRLTTFLSLMVVMTGMFMVMYVQWTPLVEEPMGGTVNGLQGRYFIPVFCFGFIVLFNNLGEKVPLKIREKTNIILQNVSSFWIIVNPCVTVLLLVLRYWCKA